MSVHDARGFAYSRGPVRNLVEVMEWRCFGLFRSPNINWFNTYSMDEISGNRIL